MLKVILELQDGKIVNKKINKLLNATYAKICYYAIFSINFGTNYNVCQI